MRPRLVALVALVALAAGPAEAAPAIDLTTTFETSGGARTGGYDEVLRLCGALPRAFPGRVRCLPLATTAEGRRLVALVASADGTLDGGAARRRRRPVVLVQGGIHAGEIDGKDAGLLFLRGLLDGSAARRGLVPADALRGLTFVFVPVYNVDGHERRGRHNRPNQRGPEEMGFRTTAANLNLNRDYMKADAVETRALLGLLGDWDPILYVDLHVTDGAKFQHEVAVLVAPLAGEPGLVSAAAALRREAGTTLAARGWRPITEFYPAFLRDEEPASGFAVGDPPPRFSNGYWSLRRRLATLVETHSWKEYPLRVRATVDTLGALVTAARRDGARWLEAAAAADRAAANLGGQEVVLAWESGPQSRLIDFLGYAYTVEKSAVSGGPWIRYDEGRPEIWRVPLRDRVVPARRATAPRGGYLVSPGWAAEIAPRLTAHGVAFRTLGAPRPAAAVQLFRASRATFAPAPFEGRTRLTVEGSWSPEVRTLPSGALFVPIAQPRAALVVQLFEPSAPDSFLSWGFFNGAFEQKEYLEPYVAEELARQMLAADPALRKAFDERLAKDSKFAADPHARLDFFYRRSPYWDDRAELYPVFRLDAAP